MGNVGTECLESDTLTQNENESTVCRLSVYASIFVALAYLGLGYENRTIQPYRLYSQNFQHTGRRSKMGSRPHAMHGPYWCLGGSTRPRKKCQQLTRQNTIF